MQALEGGRRPISPAGEPPPDIEVFVREGCPHCAAAELFLEDLRRERPDLTILIRDVDRDAAARLRLNELVEQFRGRGSAGWRRGQGL